MTAIVVTGGRGPRQEIAKRRLANPGLVCACDSGFELAIALGFDPDVVVGDMDSISDSDFLSALPSERVIRYPKDKDETDTEIGIRTAKERGAEEIVIVGGGGGRLDHLLGILSILHRDPQVASWLTHNAEVTQITTEIDREDLRGQTVSFFPLAGEACSMRSRGLKWPLDDIHWTVGDAGISNVITGDRMTVEMITGRLIMVCPYGG